MNEVEAIDMDRITKREKREFARRCKAIAERDGHRNNYHPARFEIVLFDDLLIYWRPDEQCLLIRLRQRNRKPSNEHVSMVLEEVRTQRRWGCLTHLREHLNLLREKMVLDDLADA